jgi:hypothetical protein
MSIVVDSSLILNVVKSMSQFQFLSSSTSEQPRAFISLAVLVVKWQTPTSILQYFC